MLKNKSSSTILSVMTPLHRGALIAVGTLALGLGVLGVFVPGLPTTPFLLVASGCYLRSSAKLYGWLMSKPWLSERIRTYTEKKALPLKLRIVTLIIAWAVLGYLALFVAESLLVKTLLVSIAVVKTLAMIAIKTLR